MLGAIGAGAVVVAAAATGWACVAGTTLRLDRQVVAPGGQLELTITVAGTPNPPPMAIRLDQLDAPPLLGLVPTGTTPSVVRVTIPATTPIGQHILIADDDPYPLPKGKYGYLASRALFSVVAPDLAAANPTLSTVLDLAPPVPFPDIRDQLWAMGAELVRLHYVSGAGGEFVNTAGTPLSTVLTTLGSTMAPASGAPAMIDSLTLQGQVERASLGPLAGRVVNRSVVGLPPPTAPRPAELDAEAHRLPVGPAAVAALALALALATTGATILAGRRR
jgi:hypothetical protein